jgi:hypothetical protein
MSNRKRVPTHSPTNVPTNTPTQVPTNAPSQRPTQVAHEWTDQFALQANFSRRSGVQDGGSNDEGTSHVSWFVRKSRHARRSLRAIM